MTGAVKYRKRKGRNWYGHRSHRSLLVSSKKLLPCHFPYYCVDIHALASISKTRPCRGSTEKAGQRGDPKFIMKLKETMRPCARRICIAQIDWLVLIQIWVYGRG